MSRWQWFQLTGFQVFWWAAVILRNDGLVLFALWIVLHITFSPTRKDDFFVMSLAVVGGAADGLLTLAGVFKFDQFPVWLAALWVMFVLTLGHSLQWIRRMRLSWQILLGAFSGAISYFGGMKLGAVHWPLGVLPTALLIGAVWGGLLPFLVRADQHLRNRNHSSQYANDNSGGCR